MENLFQQLPLQTRSFFQRIFRQYPDDNVVIEINNLLASRPVMKITQEQVLSIVRKYQIDINKVYKKNLYEFYAVYLNRCLKVNDLSPDRVGELKHLQRLLHLGDKEVEFIHTSLAGVVYKKYVSGMIVEGRWKPNADHLLKEKQNYLQLSDEVVKKISAGVREQYVTRFLDGIVAAKRYSPSDEMEFLAMSESLQATVTMDNTSKARMNKFRLYWKLENEPLSELTADIPLQKDERCYFIGKGEWYEERTSSRSMERWKPVDSGEVYLTDKRIILVGIKKSSNVRLDRIVSHQQHGNDVEIRKETGKDLLISCGDRGDIFEILLKRILSL